MPQGDRSVEPLTGGLPSSPAVPDRHIFRVGSDGRAQPTGTTAPREPSRAITPMRRAHPAVEAPPPSLTVPNVQPKKTKPTRRRSTAAGAGIAGELEGTAMTALPPAKTTRVPRKKAAPAEAPVTTVVAEKPKRAPRKKAESAAAESGVKKPAVRKRSTTAKTTAKKKK
jgi:sec-independent protein translocase protein TatB